MPITPLLNVFFYRSNNGTEPVRDWLKSLNVDERRTIGTDIKTVQYGWPIVMPLVRYLEKDIWEIRSNLESRIARVLFVTQPKLIILVHGFIKKQQKTPKQDIKLAMDRLKILRGRK
jgi:phage-related protein